MCEIKLAAAIQIEFVCVCVSVLRNLINLELRLLYSVYYVYAVSICCTTNELNARIVGIAS